MKFRVCKNSKDRVYKISALKTVQLPTVFILMARSNEHVLLSLTIKQTFISDVPVQYKLRHNFKASKLTSCFI
jgi:hypothetical protein